MNIPHRIFLRIVITLFLFDRIFKYVVQNLPAGKVFAFSPGLEFGYFLNPSLFFFPAWRFIPYFALAVLCTLVVLFLVTLYKHRKQNRAIGYWSRPQSDRGSSVMPGLLAIGSILLGGGSNVFDRFAFRGVIDYVHIVGLATINIADILILLGILLLIFRSNLYDQRS